jgi:hypothetical protein
MMCSTDEQQRQESGWNGASVLQEAPHLRDLLPTLDRAWHDSLREMQPGALEAPEIAPASNYERDVKAGVCVRCHKRPATPTNKRCQKCQDYHANQERLK